MSVNIATRPNTAPGHWLCGLIPIAYLVGRLRFPQSTNSFHYKFILIASFALCFQSATFFIYLSSEVGKFLKVFYVFLPGIFMSLALYLQLNQTLFFSCFWGIATPLFYQIVYITNLKALPKSFTYGEASIIVQGLTLFTLNAIFKVPMYCAEHPQSKFLEMCAIMTASLFFLAVGGLIIYAVPLFRKTIFFYMLMALLVFTICLAPVTKDPPIVTVIAFIFDDVGKMFLIIFFIGCVGMAITAVLLQLEKSTTVTSSDRKVFHILAVLVFVPGLIFQCSLMYISTGVALSFLILLETIRLLDIPPFAKVIQTCINVFLDEKDSGKVVLTPIYLLTGCALPLWISPAPCSLTDTAMDNIVPLLSGILSVGVGDSAASFIGARFGRHKWPGSNKSLEGTVASIATQIAVVNILFVLKLKVFQNNSLRLIATVSAIVATSILEGVTDQIDNLVLPLVFYIISSLA